MKDVGLRIRVQRGLREQFLKVCRAQDKPAAQVIRDFMRRYVAEHSAETSQTAQSTKRDALNRTVIPVKQG